MKTKELIKLLKGERVGTIHRNSDFIHNGQSYSLRATLAIKHLGDIYEKTNHLHF